MQSLFTKEGAGHFVNRINRLEGATPPLWGKMNVAQMLAHCQMPLNIAAGRLRPKSNAFIRFLFGRIARKNLSGPKQFGKNLPTFTEAKIFDERDFETEKQKLLSLLLHFQSAGVNGLTKDIHPYFGELSPAQWDALQSKHLDHHLRQFGV